MPLSRHLAEVVNALRLNLVVFGESAWAPDTRKRLIDESIAVLDEIVLDPVFGLTLSLVRGANLDREEVAAVMAGGEPLIDFLNREAILLKGSRYEDQTVSEVVEEVRRTVQAGFTGLVPPEEVFKSLVKLKFSLEEQRHQDAPMKSWGKAARKLVVGLGGAGLVTLNVSGFALTMGITAPLAALSGAVGGTILGECAKGALARLLGEHTP